MARREAWPDERIGAIELESYIADRIDRNEARRESPRRVPRRVAAAAAVLLAAAGLTVTAAAAKSAVAAPRAAQPARPAWQIVKQVHGASSGGFSVVIAVGKNGGWAFNLGNGGAASTAWHRSGSTWTQIPFPGQNQAVVAAGASSPSNVWAFTADGAGGRALRWNGHVWTVQHSFAEQIGGAVVISQSDVWVFGQPYVPGAGLGAWHYNGRTWSHVASGHGLEGGSALSANNIWAFDGTDIAHWNGATWCRTSVSYLLPAKHELNDPMITGIFAQSGRSVYAIANGNLQDEGGPIVILHWDGYQWYRVAEGNYGFGDGALQQASSDGHGGLWIPMPGAGGQKSYLLHYSAGHLTSVALPGGPYLATIGTVALVPGTHGLLAGGTTHAYANPGVNITAVLLQYGR